MTRKEYVRKAFPVVAEEVGFDNVHEVATWCKGTVVMEETRLMGTTTKLPVIVLDGQGASKGKKFNAHLGCFIVELRGSFRVYRPAQFFDSFEEKVEEDEMICVNAVIDDDGVDRSSLLLDS